MSIPTDNTKLSAHWSDIYPTALNFDQEIVEQQLSNFDQKILEKTNVKFGQKILEKTNVKF